MAGMISKMSILPSASTVCSSYLPVRHAPGMERPMVTLALYVRLEAKPGQEAALKAFLESALPLAQGEKSIGASVRPECVRYL
jgi:hypothetical protein